MPGDTIVVGVDNASVAAANRLHVATVSLDPDPYRELAEEMVAFLRGGVLPKGRGAHVDAEVIAAWERRLKILKNEPK